jgi:hypothetical protein
MTLGWDKTILFTTNGLLVTEQLCKKLKPFRIKAWVSLHRPEKAKEAVDILSEYGMLLGVSIDPAINAVDWAGQVKWKLTADVFGNPCDWRKQGWCMVLADGRISTCCFDSDGSGVVGHVSDTVGSAKGMPYRLCKTCHLDVGFVGWRDRVEAGAVA